MFVQSMCIGMYKRARICIQQRERGIFLTHSLEMFVHLHRFLSQFFVDVRYACVILFAFFKAMVFVFFGLDLLWSMPAMCSLQWRGFNEIVCDTPSPQHWIACQRHGDIFGNNLFQRLL